MLANTVQNLIFYCYFILKYCFHQYLNSEKAEKRCNNENILEVLLEILSMISKKCQMVNATKRKNLPIMFF